MFRKVDLWEVENITTSSSKNSEKPRRRFLPSSISGKFSHSSQSEGKIDDAISIDIELVDKIDPNDDSNDSITSEASSHSDVSYNIIFVVQLCYVRVINLNPNTIPIYCTVDDTGRIQSLFMH